MNQQTSQDNAAQLKSEDLLLSQVRIIQLHFSDPIHSPSTHVTSVADMPRLLQAIIDLHIRPINPKQNAARVWKVTAHSLCIKGPYWWTTPGLTKNDDPNGARVIVEGVEEILFEDKPNNYEDLGADT